MLLAARNQHLKEMPLQEGLQSLQATGAEAVELCHENPLMGPQVMEEALAERIGGWAQEAGLRVCATGWHADFVADDAIYEQMQQLIPLAPLMDADIFIIACVGRGEGASWETAVERTSRLCELAERAGVRLALEYEPGFMVDDAETMLRLMDEVGSDLLRANADLGHVFLQEEDPLETIERLGRRIVHCHVENMATGVHQHLPPWEGDMDLGAYIGALSDTGYDGALSLDLYDVDYLTVAPRCFSYLAELLEQNA